MPWRGSFPHLSARSVVIVTGARYRRLILPVLDAIEGLSVHYWASPIEAKLCAIVSPAAGYLSELKNICVWVKDNGGMGTFYRSRHELVHQEGPSDHTG
jgi:hypothetical protein